MAHYDGSKYATKYGPSCPQFAGQIYDANYTSEDCLLVNIWTPPSARDAPVLFWIHGTLASAIIYIQLHSARNSSDSLLALLVGGGLAFGGGSAYNGSALAGRHGAIVVTINYRLGILGSSSFTDQVAKKMCTGSVSLLYDVSDYIPLPYIYYWQKFRTAGPTKR